MGLPRRVLDLKVGDLPDDETVFLVTGKESKVAHLRSGCRRLVNAINVRGPVDVSVVPDGKRICKWCEGFTRSTDPDFSHYESLKREAEAND